MKSILIIIPYFGPFPKMFTFWLASALKNTTIDFLVFTNNDLKSIDNIKVIRIEFDEMKSIIQSFFDFTISIPSPYKLCDFRGAYGNIFSEYIQNYDFWGFGDIDLIYGNIRDFFTDKILDAYWIISGWGHLTLYKNSSYTNNFFKTKIDGCQYYKSVFSSPINTAFDEYNHKGLGDMWKLLHPDKIWDSRLFDDVSVPRLNFNFISEFHPECSNKLIFEYSSGNLFRIYQDSNGDISREPILYAHLQQRSFMKVCTFNTHHFLILPNKFVDFEVLTIYKLNKWTKPKKNQKYMYNLNKKISNRLKIIFKK